jgi:preprotein translocase subunit SecF
LRPLRLVPDGTAIHFMRGRFAGVIVSAVLSTISVVLFFYPGLNLGVDFRGGVVVELRGHNLFRPRPSARRLRHSVSAISGCKSSARPGTFWSGLTIRPSCRMRSE